MLAEFVVIGGVVSVVVGLLEVAARFDVDPTERLTPEAVIRAAMRGPEGSAVRAEFRRSGICPPEPSRPQAYPGLRG